MSFWRRSDPAAADLQRQAEWSNQSRAIGEGRVGPFGQVASPGFFQRLVRVFSPVEQRSITSLPWDVGAPLRQTMAIPSPDVALSLGAVYAAQSLIARTIAGLPLHAYRDVKGKKSELDSLPSLFDQPSVQGDLFDWLHRCITSMLNWGNAYGLVTNRDGFGYPTGIEWLSPEHMTVVDFAFTGPGSFLDPIWRWRGRTIPKENLVHIPWFTRPWKVLGLSPLQAYAASVNTGLGAQKFSGDWFANGGVPPGTFKNAVKTVPREEAQEIKQRLTDSIRSHQPIVYGADWDYNPIAVNPQEAQFIETMKLTATQIAVIYGVPPDRIGGEKSSSLTYSTVEQDSIDFVQFTILNYARKLESAFFRILPTRQYVRFNLDALIRPDVKTRHQVYMLDRQMGLRNIDEIRDMENLPPLPNGEGESYAPLIATGLAPEIEPPGAPGTSGPGAEDSPGALSQVIKAKPRKPYSDLSDTGDNGNRSWYRALWPVDPQPPPVNVTVNIPERELHHHAGDVIVHPAPPAEVRIEQPVTFQVPDIQVPVNVTAPEVRVDSPVTVTTPEVQVPVTVQPANVTAPVTVNTPEVQVSSPDVTVQPAVVNVAMPEPRAKTKQITTKRHADGSSTATIREKED